MPSGQVPQRSLRGGQTLLRLELGQQRDRVPFAQRHLLLRENVRAYPRGRYFRHSRHSLPVRVEERLRGPRGEPSRPHVLLAPRHPGQTRVPLRLFPRQTTIHRRSHGILRPGVAFQGGHPTRLAGHPSDHAPLRRLGRMRQTRPYSPRDTAEQAERVRRPTRRPAGERVPGTLAPLPEISAEDRDDRFREDARIHCRAERRVQRFRLRTVSDSGRAEAGAAREERPSPPRIETSLPVPDQGGTVRELGVAARDTATSDTRVVEELLGPASRLRFENLSGI